ncbi:MAG: PAS domain S-box protein [Haloferacaceae archaeon]
MTDNDASHGPRGRILGSIADLNRAETVEAAVARAVEVAETAFDQPVVSLCEYDPETGTTASIGSTAPPSSRATAAPDRIPDPVARRLDEPEDDRPAADTPDVTVDTDPREPLGAEALVPVGRTRVLRLGVTDPEGLDETGLAAVEGIATTLEAALARIDRRRQTSVDCEAARAAFDGADDATFVSDTDGGLVAANSAAVELTGRDRAELLTTGLSEIHGEAAAAVADHLESAASGATASLATTLPRADDPDVTVELASRRVGVDGATYVCTTARTRPEPTGEGADTRRPVGSTDDRTGLRRLNELTAAPGAFDETVERLLSLGCDHFGLETGILSHVDGDDYEVEAVVDATGTHEAGAVYGLGDTMCDVTLAGDRTETLAFADVTDTAHRDHPAAANVRAYIAAPVVVGDEPYGTVNFSMGRPRSDPFRPDEREFVTLVARWIGAEIERRRRLEELERYETILEAVDDPVYALDPDGRFIVANEAARRELGDGEETRGERLSGGRDGSGVEQVQKQAADLRDSGARSAVVEFELETADGDHRTVENRLALIGDEEVRGTAGVLRDITGRKERQRQLESFQQAVDEAADGVAILDDGEYTYVDRTHVEMYGFDETEQLLGDSWRKLYDDDEIERIEREAFPALESEGYWRGMVTGSRPDGSTFPAELSLTIVDDGRLVCTVRDETERKERERDLRLKERAIDEANVGITISDPDQEGDPLVYVNDGFVEQTGYAREEVLGRNLRLLQGADTDPEQVARLQEAFDAEEPVSLRLRTYRSDGTPYWSELSVTPVDGEDGSVTAYIGIQQDVTERVERNQWRREFLNRGPLMLLRTRAVDGEAVVDSCGDQLLRRLGYDRGDVEGEPLASLYAADSAADLREGGYDDALSGEFETGERTLVDADGNDVHTLLRAVPRPDETTGTHALFVDISERTERERRQQARTELLGRVYEVMTDRRLGFEERLSELLDAGREHLDLQYAFLTDIKEGDEGTGTQSIVQAIGSHDLLQSGESVPLSQSYCRETIADDGVVALTNAAEDGWAGDPAYETFGLETYLGSEVVAGDGVYGTVCFAASDPREDSFDEFERTFVNLLGRWAGYEIDRRTAREELRQQQERLELTLSGTDTGIAEWDLETDAVTWNETLVELVGYDVGSFEEFEAAVHPDDRDRVREGLSEMIETGEPWVDEFRIVDDDGDVVWIGPRAVPTYDDEGTPNRVLAIGTDITDRKREEFERRRSERQYRTLVENIPNGAVLTFGADLEYSLAAGELLPAFGLETSDIVGESVGEVLADDSQRQTLVPRFRAALDGDRTDRRIELDDRTLRLHIVPVEAGGEGLADTRGLLLAQDVTDEARRERDLREERERFRLLTESVDEYAFLVVDGDGAVQTWNEGAEATFGYDAEAAVGMPVADLHPEVDRESGRVDRLLQQARIAGESAHEGWRVRADGSEFYADVRYAPLEADDGEFRGYAVIVRDMTDRRRQRRRTETFVEESEDVVTIVDTDGTITYASGSAERVLGYDPDDLAGENLFDRVHPDHRERAMETFFASIENPDANFRAECRLRSGDGEWRNVEGQCRNMLDDDAIDGMLLYLRDVTERKERARRYESIFNQTFQLTGLLDPDGTIVEVNDAVVEFSGAERDAIVGEPFVDASWWAHSEAVRDDVRDAIERARGGEFVRYETEMRGADGLATIDFSAKPVTDDDGEVSLLVVEGRDVTTREQYRRNLAVMRRVMRHNIRNDLSKLRGWTRMMCDEPDAERRAEQFETVNAVLDRWEAMTEKAREIREVLDSGVDDRGRTEAGPLIEDALAPVRDAYADVTVTTDVSVDESRQVRTSLREAVRELAENAADTGESTTVGVDLASGEDGWIEVSVRDDGPGLPEMEAEVLETGEETPLAHGEGLGLWMARMIVVRAGGEVSVETTDDGTTVYLRLPTRQTAVPGTSSEPAG